MALGFWENAAAMHGTALQTAIPDAYETALSMPPSLRCARVLALEEALSLCPAYAMERARIKALLELDEAAALTFARVRIAADNQMPYAVLARHKEQRRRLVREFSRENQVRVQAIFPEVFGQPGNSAKTGPCGILHLPIQASQEQRARLP